MSRHSSAVFFFFFNDTATTEIYTLSLHDALPILRLEACNDAEQGRLAAARRPDQRQELAVRDVEIDCVENADIPEGLRNSAYRDRKSTRLNSSHLVISYAVFCLKKKIKISTHILR